MGMYTELNIGVEFKKNTPAEIIAVLDYMATKHEGEPKDFGIKHPLFQTSNWDWMLRSAGSYYFDAKPSLTWRFDDIAHTWFLTVCTNIKNHSEEWEEFLDFIAPHLETEGYIGTYRYEEADTPTLLFVEDGKVEFRDTFPKPGNEGGK